VEHEEEKLPWTPPSSVEEAIKMRDQLGLDVQVIQDQLSHKDRTVDYRRMTPEEYWQWHHRAAAARQSKIRKIKKLKDYIRENQSTHKRPPRSTIMTRALLAILKRLGGEDELVAEIEEWLKEAQEE